MKKEITCIICPNGCSLEIETDSSGNFLSVSGELCPRGKGYAEQEVSDPRRTIATSVRLLGGELPLASVRLTKPVPKVRIFDIMKEIRSVKIWAPAVTGTVIIHNILGLESDVIVTKDVAEIKQE